MIDLPAHLTALFHAVAADRAKLAMENVVLRDRASGGQAVNQPAPGANSICKPEAGLRPAKNRAPGPTCVASSCKAGHHPGMPKILSPFLALADALTIDRTRLAIETVILRQQLAVLRRMAKCPRIEDEERDSWAFVLAVFKNWMYSLVIVEPETVVRWHREGFARDWTKRSLERIRPDQAGRQRL
ncbi:MAG: hypothetical protein KDB53_14245 [Planctomycetes bacterium]|nr:hypothetical protein [Planctomycetota bacterium]